MTPARLGSPPSTDAPPSPPSARRDERTAKATGFAGQQSVVLPDGALAVAQRRWPLLRGLSVTAAGYLPKAAGHLRQRPQGCGQAIAIFCVKGGGWCELAGQRHRIRAGDLLVLPPGVPHRYGAQATNPWTIHWAHAAGSHLAEYLHAMGVSPARPVLGVGEDLELTRLFNAVLKSLAGGPTGPNLLLAAHALAHLFAVTIHHRHERPRPSADGVEKVAQGIVYMSEHLDGPLRVSALAALANLSAAHFTALFKVQTGCSPRAYLHLLRIHRACQLLGSTTLSVKAIAARLGYRDPLHFSRQFKAFQGTSPSDYRTGAGPGAA